MSDNSKILQFKNQKLREQIELQKREKVSLEEKVSALESKQTDYENNLLCVHKLWGELNREIAILASRLDAAQSALPGIHDDLEGKALASAPDPFLQRLVRGSGWSEAKVMEHIPCSEETQQSTLEKELRSKCEASKAALAGIIGKIDAANAQRHKAWADDAGDGPASGAQKLTEEIEHLQRELDGFRAANLASDSRYAALQNELLKAEKRGLDLSNELADKQEEVVILQRKLISARAKAEEDEQAAAGASSSAGGRALGDGSKGKDSDASLLLAEERKRMEKRTSELEEERKLSRQLRLELRESKLALQDETRYLHSKLHQDMVSRLNMLNAEFSRHREVANQLRRDLDLATARENELSLKASKVERLERLQQTLESRSRDLEIQKVSATKARDEAKAKIQELNEKLGKADTVGQLKMMVATLQKEISMLQANNTKLKASGERLESALEEAESCKKAQATLEAEKDELQKKLTSAEEERRSAMESKTGLEDKTEDLRVFVEVLQSIVAMPKDVGEIVVRAKRAEEKVSALEHKLSRHELSRKAAAAEAEARKAEEALELKEKERISIQLERDSLFRQQCELKEQLEAQKSEMEAYIQEIDVIGSAYEDMQSQNTSLLQQMTERDALNHSLQSERLQLEQRVASLQEEKDMCQSKVTAAEAKAEALQIQEAELNSRVVKLMEDVSQGRQKLWEVTTQLEEKTAQCKEHEQALADKQTLIEAGQKHVAELQKTSQELGEKLETERLRRQRIEEELKIAQGRIERLKRKEDAAGVNKELERELEDMRTLLRCSVCHERQKNVIITKCYHMFCRQCIQRNLDTRHRKCPGCGVAFGSTDVKNCFFT